MNQLKSFKNHNQKQTNKYMGSSIGLLNWEIQLVGIQEIKWYDWQSKELCLVLFSDNFSLCGSKIAIRSHGSYSSCSTNITRPSLAIVYIKPKKGFSLVLLGSPAHSSTVLVPGQGCGGRSKHMKNYWSWRGAVHDRKNCQTKSNILAQ